MRNIFIVNKASKTGKGAAVWEALEAHLQEMNVDYDVRFTGGPGEATEFARSATGTGEPTHLFVMGGDGTLNEALNGIVDFENTFYTPLPSGSANDFVLGIGMEGDAIQIFDRAYNSADYKLFDIGTVGDRRFGVSAGIGVDAYVCLQALDSKLKKFLNRFGLGSATYGLLTVGDIFTMPFSDAEMTYWFEGKETTIKVKNIIFAAAMNCRAEGGGIPMAPDAKPDSGYLTAFVAHDISRLKCFTLLPSLVAGKHMGKKGFDLIKFDKTKISIKKPMCVHADGEHVGFLETVEFTCIPGILKVKGL